jgi:hypothetical protein
LESGDGPFPTIKESREVPRAPGNYSSAAHSVAKGAG